MRKLFVCLFLFCDILILSCSNNKKQEEFDYGRVENNKYINSYFDLELSLPPEWVVQTKEQTEIIVNRGKDLISGDDKNMKAVLKASEINTANLLVLSQYEIGSPVDYNPSFMLVAENLNAFPGIKNGSDYLFQARKLIKQSQIQYDSIDDEFKKVSINNQEFYLMNASLTYGEYTIKQEYYSTIKNGFSIGAIISFISDEQKNNLEDLINSIQFKN